MFSNGEWRSWSVALSPHCLHEGAESFARERVAFVLSFGEGAEADVEEFGADGLKPLHEVFAEAELALEDVAAVQHVSPPEFLSSEAMLFLFLEAFGIGWVADLEAGKVDIHQIVQECFGAAVVDLVP